jgi:hypothetical protein
MSSSQTALEICWGTSGGAFGAGGTLLHPAMSNKARQDGKKRAKSMSWSNGVFSSEPARARKRKLRPRLCVACLWQNPGIPNAFFISMPEIAELSRHGR